MKHFENAYFLIDDTNARSGWDFDARGTGAAIAENVLKGIAPKCVNCVGNGLPVVYTRPVTRQTHGVLTFECVLSEIEGDGFFLGFFDGETEAFALDFNDGRLGVGSLARFDENGGMLMLVLDIDKGVADVYLDGKARGSYPFTGAARGIDALRFGFDGHVPGKATMYNQVRLYKNYLLNDMCLGGSARLPCFYRVSDEAAVTSRDYNGRGHVYSLSGVSSFTRPFARTAGKVCFQLSYLAPGHGGRSSFALTSSGKDAVTLYDENMTVSCAGGALRNHSEYVFQTLRMEADTETQTASIRLNGKVVSVIPFDAEAYYFDGIRVSFDGKNDAMLSVIDLRAFAMPPEPHDYVPEPIVPKKPGGQVIGMNVCSLWREGNHFGWDCISPYKENKPLLGWYDEGIPEVADWEIKWLCEHGVDFELYCWYAPYGNAPFHHTHSFAMHDGHMLAKYRDKVKLALLWEANSAAPEDAEAFHKYYVPYWIDHFFSDPDYMKIGNTAVMSVYSPDRMVTFFGSVENARQELNYLRNEVKKLGYDGLIILCCGTSAPERFKEMGFDGVHAYNWGTPGCDPDYTKKGIEGCIANGAIHTVPTISAGFNIVAWMGYRSPNMTPSDMADVLTWVRDDVLPTFDRDSWQSKLVMLSTWNEYGEGTYICPSGLNRFGYLDAVRHVFTDDLPHTDIAPNDRQKARLGYLHPKDREFFAPQDAKMGGSLENCTVCKRYEFKTEEDLAKWEFHGFASLTIKDGRLFGHSDEHDPYMVLKDDTFLPLRAGRVCALRAHIRAYKPVNQICCVTATFSTSPDGAFPSRGAYHITDPSAVVPIDLELRRIWGLPWRGIVTAFRFDPIYAVGDFELEAIEFLATEAQTDLVIDGQYMMLSGGVKNIDGTYYLPFDVKRANSIVSPLLGIRGLYYEWNAPKGVLTLYGKDKYVFTKDSDLVTCGENTIRMARPLTFLDGIPYIPLPLFADITGRKMRVGDDEIRLDEE